MPAAAFRSRWTIAPVLACAVAVAATAWLAAAAPQPPARTSPRSGLDLDAFDRTVRPQDDLYRFANGTWLQSARIPADRTTTGTFTDLTDGAESDLRALIEEILRQPGRGAGSIQQQVADFYQSVIDEARVNALGLAPIRAELDRIESATARSAIATEAGVLTSTLGGGPFALTAVVDARDGTVVAQVTQGGTLLPTRDHYLSVDPAMADIRAKYEAYLARIFTLAGRANPRGDARGVVAFETRVATVQLTIADAEAATRAATATTIGAAATAMPGFDWIDWARPQGLSRSSRISFVQPDFFQRFAEIAGATPLPILKAWPAARHLTAMAPYLSQPFVDARFGFFGTTLTGQTEPRARWKIGVSLVSSLLSDAVGRLYVERHFPPSARTRATRLVEHVVRAYRDAIADATWLSGATRAEADAKLARVSLRIGYPDAWRSYAGLSIAPDDLVGNLMRARRLDSEYRMSHVATTAGSGEWLVTPQTVNAFYNPALNAMFLPAAMLQAPQFDSGADDATNYGGLGAIVGHELSHALDERGRGYDAAGAARRWWSDADLREFRRRTDPLVAAFARFGPAPGLSVNGDLTLSENLADLLGLSVAHRAYVASLGGKPAPVLDGFSGDQRFFLGYARMWRVKVRDDYLRQWLLTLPYAPYEYRTNGIVEQLDAFHVAFGTAAGDALFRAPEARVRVW